MAGSDTSSAVGGLKNVYDKYIEQVQNLKARSIAIGITLLRNNKVKILPALSVMHDEHIWHFTRKKLNVIKEALEKVRGQVSGRSADSAASPFQDAGSIEVLEGREIGRVVDDAAKAHHFLTVASSGSTDVFFNDDIGRVSYYSQGGSETNGAVNTVNVGDTATSDGLGSSRVDVDNHVTAQILHRVNGHNDDGSGVAGCW